MKGCIGFSGQATRFVKKRASLASQAMVPTASPLDPWLRRPRGRLISMERAETDFVKMYVCVCVLGT